MTTYVTEPLPDLLGLSVRELRRLEHPVLTEVLEDMQARVDNPATQIWFFQQSAPLGWPIIWP
ncbi:FXSXX-COOH protein [Streptomyces sp. B8F3]|uniref:FXSXX-COOH protein n=1 Tax=unclassified Streptomyces TaxID=2593676 RepID=UPI00325E7D01